VAPVPFFPRVNIHSRWYEYARIPKKEQIAGFQLDHPRYILVPKVAMGMHALSMFAGSFRRVFQRSKEHHFELIDAHYVYPDGLAAVMLGKLLGLPVVVSARGSDIHLFSTFRTIRPLIARALQRADAVIAVSQGLKDRMVQLGCPGEKIVVIGNGVDAKQFRPASQAEMRARLNLPLGSPIVVSVGNLKEGKGFHVLIDAFARLRGRGRDIMLVIVGGGPDRALLEKKIKAGGLEKSVYLAGAQPHESLAEWYNAADIFCLASSSEGCPNVVLEAMACGLPVVTTAAAAELVTSPALGIVTDRTATAFEAAIDEAFLRMWDRDLIVAHARNRTWSDVASRVLDVFSSVVSRHAVAAGS
jgi:glycosyltransferase involved in cell wall biosynthesis